MEKTKGINPERYVLLLGVTRNTGNCGVRVLLSGAVTSLHQGDDGCGIRVLDYGRAPEVWIEEVDRKPVSVPLVNLRFSWKLALANNIFLLVMLAFFIRLFPSARLRKWFLSKNRYLKEVMNAEAAYSVAGGDSFSDIYRMERFLYVALPQILVLLVGCPLTLLPQTYGPFRGWTCRKLAKFIFRRATRIYSRDSAGIKTVQGIAGPRTKVEAIPDMGLVMVPKPVDEAVTNQVLQWKGDRVVVGLNISKLLYMGGYTKDNMFGLKEDHTVLVRAVLDFLCAQSNYFVLLVPHVFGEQGSVESELMLYRSLWPELQARYGSAIGFLDQSFDHREVKSVIGLCDVFAGGRMHACIGAVSQGIPTVALAYSDKFAGVMHMVDESIVVADLRTLDQQKICELLQQTIVNRKELGSTLKNRMPKVVAAIRETFSNPGVADGTATAMVLIPEVKTA